MGTYLNKGVNFTTGQQVTATDLNNLVDNATIASGAGDGSTIDVTNSVVSVLNGGITPQKLSTGGPTWDSTGKLDLTGNLSVGGTATITGDTALSGDITVTGSKTLSGTQLKLDCRDANIGESSNTQAVLNIGNVGGGVTQSIHAEGTSHLSGNVSCGGTLSVSGNTTLFGNLAVTGSISGGSGNVLAKASVTLISNSPITNNSTNATIAADTSEDSGNVKAYKVTMATAAPDANYNVIIKQISGDMASVASVANVTMKPIAGTGTLAKTTTQFHIGVDNPPSTGLIFEITVIG
jgi:hypothetical protein